MITTFIFPFSVYKKYLKFQFSPYFLFNIVYLLWFSDSSEVVNHFYIIM